MTNTSQKVSILPLMKYWLHLALIICFGAVLISCTQSRELKVNTIPMHNVNIKRYMGTWYEIARLPNKYERGLDRVMARYQLKKNGRINITNSGFDAEDEFTFVHGQGYIPNPMVAGHLRVSFVYPFRWFYGDYNILYVDKDYKLALVSGGDSQYLWILSRSPQISERDKQDLLGIARARGFDTSRLLWPQPADLKK